MVHRYSGIDRRRFQRLNVNLSVFFKINSPFDLRQAYGEREREAVMLDICSVGCSFISTCDIPKFSMLSLRFYLFKTDDRGMVSFCDPVEVEGEVRSNIPMENGDYRLGICFKEIKHASQSMVSDFVASAA